MKKFLSMTLALCMLLSLLPTAQLTAMAYEETAPVDVGTIAENKASDTMKLPQAVHSDDVEEYVASFAAEKSTENVRKSDTDVAYPVADGNIYFDKETGTITDCDESVTSADIPAEIDGGTVTSIGGDAFYYCESLASVSIPDSVTSIGEFTFYKTALYNNADNWTDGVLYIDNWLIAADSISGDYSVLGGTVGIADYAFDKNPSLESITIPDSVTNIGSHALDCFKYMGGVSLKGIWVDENNQNYSSDTYGVLFNKDKTELIAAPNVIDRRYKVPDGVESIADYAFADCISLYSIIIPDSVKTIGVEAFDHCYSMRCVVVGTGVTNIGDRAFFDCEMLCSLLFLGDAPQIGNHAFVRSDWGYYCDLEYLRIYYLDGKKGYPLSEWDADRTHEFRLSGNCGKDGDNLKWSVSFDDTALTITGSGEMTSDIELGMPWGEFVYVITDIILPKV